MYKLAGWVDKVKMDCDSNEYDLVKQMRKMNFRFTKEAMNNIIPKKGYRLAQKELRQMKERNQNLSEFFRYYRKFRTDDADPLSKVYMKNLLEKYSSEVEYICRSSIYENFIVAEMNYLLSNFFVKHRNEIFYNLCKNESPKVLFKLFMEYGPDDESDERKKKNLSWHALSMNPTAAEMILFGDRLPTTTTEEEYKKNFDQISTKMEYYVTRLLIPFMQMCPSEKVIDYYIWRTQIDRYKPYIDYLCLNSLESNYYAAKYIMDGRLGNKFFEQDDSDSASDSSFSSDMAPQHIHWKNVSSNSNPMFREIFRKNEKQLYYCYLAKNPLIFDYDYEAMLQSKRELHEDFMAYYFHPSRFEMWKHEIIE